MKQTVQSTSDEINPPGHRPPLHNQISPRAALAWWSEHRYDSLGQQWLQKVGATPADVAKLDAWLSHAMQATHPLAQPTAPPATPLVKPQQPPNLESFIFRRALQREEQTEGPPVGPADA